MVGGLIKQKNVGVCEAHEGESDAGLLAVGQGGHALSLGASGDAEAAKQHTHAVLGLFGELPTHVLQRRGVHVQLVDEVLVEASNAQLVVWAHHALSGLELAQHHAQKRGLAHSVRAHNGNSRLEVDATAGGQLPAMEVLERG